MVDKIMSKVQKTQNMVQSGSESQAEAGSDPIYGTLGPPKSKRVPINDEERLEYLFKLYEEMIKAEGK